MAVSGGWGNGGVYVGSDGFVGVNNNVLDNLIYMSKDNRGQGEEPRTRMVRKLPLNTEGVVKEVNVMELVASRPAMLNNIEVVRKRMNGYLAACKEGEVMPCMAGLAVALGVSKQTLENWGKRGEEEREIQGIFKAVMEEMGVQRLFEPKMSIAAIFYLKQMGWRDDSHISTGDNRSVTQIVINNGKDVRSIDVGTGDDVRKKIKRPGGRPKKYDGYINIENLHEKKDGEGESGGVNG